MASRCTSLSCGATAMRSSSSTPERQTSSRICSSSAAEIPRARSALYVSPEAAAALASDMAPVRAGHFSAHRCKKTWRGMPSWDGPLLEGVGEARIGWPSWSPDVPPPDEVVGKGETVSNAICICGGLLGTGIMRDCS
eukprot:scaffold14563_cov242-Isochrysis_galbana.AAC.4